MATEYGVQHSQGIRPEPSAKSALEALEWMTRSFESNFRNQVRPFIVTREVTEWVQLDSQVSS